MERLHGRTLRDELEGRGALPVPEAVDILRQLLAGLDAVHAAGIVHRDVKPENIFLCASRTLKLLDFGLAKVIEAGRPGPAPLAFPTDLDLMLGTPRFFSPEQALGRPVDARSDLYSAGVVLYAMLAGRAPFDHYSALYELARAHAAEPPEPPSRYAGQPIPEALERVLRKALEKQPDDRFQTALAFSAALDEARAAPRRWQSTEKMPDLASILAAQERAIALKQTAPLVAHKPAIPAGPVLPFTAPPPRSPSPLPIAATPTPAPSSPTHLHAPRPTQSTRFLPRLLAFVLAALVSAIVFGSLATTVLLHAVR
jgi:serine/threonine protein kinase